MVISLQHIIPSTVVSVP